MYKGKNAEKTISFKMPLELYDLIHAGAVVEGSSASDYCRKYMERAARRSFRTCGLAGGKFTAGEYSEPSQPSGEWEAANIPPLRARAWEALGIDAKTAGDYEILHNISPVEYVNQRAKDARTKGKK